MNKSKNKMSDAIKTPDESIESTSNQNGNENTTPKRVFILTSEMVKRLGLDEKIKIFKDKVKVDSSIKPVSVVQIDKDKTQLIIREPSNGEIDSDTKNKSASNGEGSNNTKDLVSDTLSVDSENEKEKEANKKSIPVITHHVETLEKPLILRRSSAQNGIVVLNPPNENKMVLPINKLKLINNHKANVIKSSGVRKPGELIPRKLARIPNNSSTGAVNNKANDHNDATNSNDDIIFVDAIKSNKNDALEGLKKPNKVYSRITHRKNYKGVNALSPNSKPLPGSKIIKLSTINSNASRDTILNSKDLVQLPTGDYEKIFETINVDIEEVSSEDPKSSKNKNDTASKKKKPKPPPKKKIKVIDVSDDCTTPKKRGRPRKYFTEESLARLKLLNEGGEDVCLKKQDENSESQNSNSKLEDSISNNESEGSTLNESSKSPKLNNKCEDFHSNENSEIQNLKKELEVSNLSENSEFSNSTKKLKLSNFNGETESYVNNESTDKKPILDDCNKITDFTIVDNYSENIRHKKEDVKEDTIETPIDVPVVRKGRGRPRKTPLKPPTPIEKEVVPNHVNDTVNNDVDNNTNACNDTSNNDNGENGEDDDNDEDDEEENPTHYRKRRGRRGRRQKITGWYIKPDSQKESTKPVKKKKENKEEEIQCGKCDKKMLKSKWNNHNLTKHNDTGWLSGNKEPDFENNEKLWKKVLGNAIKRKKGTLVCDKCNEAKRSVSGFISHYRFCGKTEEEKIAMMWVCPICKGIFMPSSVDFHERTHRQEMREATKKPEVVMDDDLLNDDCKRKRKAAEKATNKILEFTKIVKDELPAKKSKKSKSNLDDFIEKPLTAKKLPNVWKGKWAKDIAANRPATCRQPRCTFSANSLDEICAHFRECNFTAQTEYICKICRFFSKSNDIMESHVKAAHPEQLNSGEDSDFNANELSDGSIESDNNNCEEVDEEINNPKIDPKKHKSRNFDKFNSTYTRAKFLRTTESPQLNSLNTTYTPALKWTMQFELDNYQSKVFKNLVPNDFNLLTNSQAEDYLPELKVSMKTKQMKNTSQNFEFVKIKIVKEENLTEEEKRDKGWKSFKLFESSVINNVPTFFVGGPVWSLAWLPIPAPMYSYKINQYLAVSTHPTMENKYTVSKSYKFKNIIQIWNVGHLDHSAASTPTPQLSYIVTHNTGTVWCMEWCPSGSYHHPLLKNNNTFGEGSMKRMGLLATASSDGNVHIYSLPFPEELNFNKTEDNNLPIYHTNPVVTLHINRLLSQQNKTNWQCTSLSWSKLSGHDTIAAGFSNGFVAVWNLSSKSPLLVTKNMNTIHMNAFQHFYAHGHAVTYVGIIPVSGKNFLSTTSLDRCTKVWDLEDPYYPIDNVKKGAATNGAWLTHWLNTYTCYDDALGLGHTVSYMMGVRDPPSSVFPLLPTNSTTYGLAVSDYANGICHGTLAGDITAIFPFQMLYIKDIDKLTKKRWLVSSVELVDFGENTDGENNSETNNKDNEQSNNYERMPETYDACKDRFGIVYHDDLNNYKSNLLRKINRRNPVNSETMNTVPLEQYQFTSVNRLAWNQNPWSYLWVAAGYQNGLIRILNLKSMSVHNAVMKLLPDHAKSMMQKFDNDQISSET